MNDFIKALTTSGLAIGLTLASSYALAAGVDVNVDKNDVAIDGYDPVAYFTRSEPKKGSPKYTAGYKDAIYYFSSAKNRNSFRKAPEKYAPVYGGYCAMGVALNKKLDADPTAWKIVDGKLYLNLNKKIQKRWIEDIPGNLETATENWQDIEFLTKKQIADND